MEAVDRNLKPKRGNPLNQVAVLTPKRSSCLSYDRNGESLDNAMAESFFAVLEREHIGRRSFRRPAEAKVKSSNSPKAVATRNTGTPLWITSFPATIERAAVETTLQRKSCIGMQRELVVSE